jgi:DNA-binding MarR family transcriptional regulator
MNNARSPAGSFVQLTVQSTVDLAESEQEFHVASKRQSSDRLAAELRRVFTKLKRRLREQTQQSDLTSTQTIVLLRLEKDGPAPVSTLARAEGMRPQSMSAAVKGLLDAGLVKGSADPCDARQTLMSLTPKCKQWLQNGRAARQDWLSSAIESELNATQQAQLAAAIALMERLANR